MNLKLRLSSRFPDAAPDSSALELLHHQKILEPAIAL